MKILSILFFFLLVVEENSLAQTPEKSISGFSYFLGDLSYSSDAVFMGRRDSIAAPYVYASMGYFNRSGFYGSASASYLVATSGEERFDLFLISGGYLLIKERLSAGLSATKYFFNEASYNIQSEIESDVTAMVSYDFKIVELGLTVSGYFNSGRSPDIVSNLMLDRTFYLMNQKLLINPTVVFGAGSQYFYEEYYNSSRFGNRKGGGSNQKASGMNQDMLQTESHDLKLSEASEFKILNLETRLPLQYYYRSFIISFTPVVAFPQAPATITVEDEIYKEKLNSLFYFSAGISYWIKTGR